ncbi:DUF3553 domain-containing protein, partial [Burkholderia cenocepacia]|uniref:DUF3553 domain-containing protein n=1 Tax=Burkholderia cenocepacia TaxID=95486 RepID=UPI0038CBFFC6
ISTRRLAALLQLLIDTASVRVDGRGITATAGVAVADAASRALDRARDRARIDASRIEMLRGYAESRRCRRQQLLEYFGQGLADCETCDSCLRDREDARAAAVDAERPAASAQRSPYAVDDAVEHPAWGDGTVMAVETDRITVFFEHEGYKVLSRALVEDRELLT